MTIDLPQLNGKELMGKSVRVEMARPRGGDKGGCCCFAVVALCCRIPCREAAVTKQLIPVVSESKFCEDATDFPVVSEPSLCPSRDW